MAQKQQHHKEKHMRRISTGIVGGPILGQLTSLENALQSITTNGDINLTPNGTGLVVSNSDIQLPNNNGVRFLEDSGNGTNYVTLKAPTAVSSNITITLPDGTGSSGQALVSDGSGNLSFSSVEVATSNQTTDTGQYFIMIADDAAAATGSVSGLNYSDNKLEYQPSSGTITCTAVSATNVTATAALQGATITETSSAVLKENIVPLNNCLEQLLNLQAVEYDRIETGEHEAGLLAEEVYKHIPNIVKTDRQGNPESIAYTRLTAYLIEAVKVLSNEIKALKGA